MRTTFKLSVLSLLLLSLLSCGGKPTVAPQVPDDGGAAAPAHPVEGLDTLEHPLVAKYYRVLEFDNKDERLQFAGVEDFKYSPRQSAFEKFEGWDVLVTPWPWGVPSNNADKWLHLTLNRDAEMVLLIPEWSEPAAWLKGWETGYSSALNDEGKRINYKTYRKAFVKGQVVLPSIFETQYTLLLSEKGGTPSAEPALPEGITERPQPNQSCPPWLANSWTATGPDGKTYKGWQPQIDPIYWCYYGHDHGSDPSLVGYEAAFDYIAFHNNRQNERHEGFKGFAFKEGNVGWYINVHATTGLISRACVRHHTVTFFAKDLTTGEKLLELGYKGDYGAAVSNQNEDLVLQPQQANCPDQKAIAAETNAVKALRVFDGSTDPGDYERWRGGTNRYLGMDFPAWSTGMTLDIRNPTTGCNARACSQASLTETNAEQRTLRFHELSFSYNSLLDKSDGKAADGVFYTDAYGYVQDDDGLNTVKQFIKPGFEALLEGHYVTQDAWRGLYVKGDHQIGLELEDALSEIN